MSKALETRLAQLPYFQRIEPPSIECDYIVFDLSTAAGAAEARDRFAILTEPAGHRNLLYVHRDAGRSTRDIRVELRGSCNAIVLNKNAMHGWLKLEGDDNLVVGLGETGHQSLGATLYSGDTLLIGRNVVSWGMRVWVQGGTVCTIHDDCLLSENLRIRTTDHHSIIDLETWTQTNAPADVTIGRHVWVGPDCIINKGSQIGEGSIVAAGSMVNTTIPLKELWGGSPARKIRANISWVPSHPVADPGEIARLRGILP